MTLGTRESGVSLYPAERVRRRRGGLGILFTIVLVLLAIAVVADRVAAQAAERELRSKVVQELASRNIGYNSLDVNVGGVPFLTQVAAGRYDEITIDLTDVTLPPEAGRKLEGDAPFMWLARHMQGPLGAFAFAAPACFIVGVILH